MIPPYNIKEEVKPYITPNYREINPKEVNIKYPSNVPLDYDYSKVDYLKDFETLHMSVFKLLDIK